MPLKSSIATKIFGLAVILVFLMMTLAAFLLVQVAYFDKEMQEITSYYQPLERDVGDLNEAGLRHRLAFERWLGIISVSSPQRTEALRESTVDYTKLTDQIEDYLNTIDTALDSPPPAKSERTSLARVHEKMKVIRSSYALVTKHQKEILELVQTGHQDRAIDMLSVVDDMQNLLQEQRSQIESNIEAIVTDLTHDVTHRHAEIFWLTMAATAISVLLGLILSWFITRRLVGPVRLLMTGLQSVEKGDLTVELPVSSTDEVGALTNSFNFFVGELRAKEELRSTFGKYIDPRILKLVLNEGADTTADGGRQNMSVAFTDLVGFTSVGEHLTPTGVVNLLNRHFTLQADSIQANHGVIDKFIGDAVMAFWGAPFTAANEHPLLACRAALDQLKALGTLQTELPQLTGLRKNLPHLDIRVGISTGEVVAGSIGSENARSYTVISDTVNLASRLENANRFYGTHILICEATATGAGDTILTREIDLITVKGKSETTRIFEVLGLVEEDDSSSLRKNFAKGLAAYRKQEWDAAETAFRECLRLVPDDGPSHTFIKRITQFRNMPPAGDWNGVWQLLEK
ncbi:MAG: adenylate/guanylate cyclase domain-containing protein [Chthoniobacterales bacterium]